MFKRTVLVSLAALAAALLSVAPGAVAGGNDGSGSVIESPTGAWFVQLNGSAESFRANAKASGINFTQRFEYTKLWKGVSVQLADGADAAALRKVSGVEAIYPVYQAHIGPTETVAPDMNYAIAMTGADATQDGLGHTGDGIKVAVMDTGVDYHHPDLGGGFGAGKKVFTGWDFVGDRFNAAGTGGALIPHPDGDPDDCQGHGTHVAGIIGAKPAAEGGIKGVAPDVTFGAYRVFGCDGSTTTDIMAAAMERAAADDMDVLNMSIGSAFANWPDYPSAVAADALAESGVIVVASIGNSGREGVYSAGAPGVGKKVIGVAAFDNSHLELTTFRVSGTPPLQAGYLPATGAPEAPTTGSAPLGRTGTPTSAADACSPLAANSLAGKIALIRRGTCPFRQKVQNAQTAGAVGALIYNNVAGYFSGTVAGTTTPQITIPVVTTSDSVGAEIHNRIVATETPGGTPPTLTWTEEKGFFGNPTSGMASSFTSYGLTSELGFKPNIGAPGGLITSTYPLEKGAKATLSGTSMSSPHVAGAVALLLDARRGANLTTNWEQAKSILQNSADPVPFTGNPGFREPAHRQGAGMVDIDDAILQNVLATPSELPLGEGASAHARTITLTNSGSTDVTYNLSHLAGLSTFNTYVPALSTAGATVGFSASSVTVASGGSATVGVTITPNANPAAARSVYGGWIQFTRSGTSTPALRVPYAGFHSDYQSLAVITAGACRDVPFPALFKRGGSTTCVPATATAPAVEFSGFTKQNAGATYNVDARDDRPVIVYQLGHQAYRLEIWATNDTTKESFLVAFGDRVRRTATNDLAATGYFTYTWDGKYVADSGRSVNRRAVPAGTYTLRLVAQEFKAFNEPENAPFTTEDWTSPTLNIVRNG